MKRVALIVLVLLGLLVPASVARGAGLTVGTVTPSVPSVGEYDSISFSAAITNSVATTFQFPYDTTGANGIAAGTGISVDGQFLPPGQTDWTLAVIQPGFLYQVYEETEAGLSPPAGWAYPTGAPQWTVRFAPTQVGTWTYRIRTEDASTAPGFIYSASSTFTVTPAVPGQHGFLQPSPTDSRYFEYSDGTPFLTQGANTGDQPGDVLQTLAGSRSNLANTFGANGVDLVRAWLSASTVAGSAWSPWQLWENGSGTQLYYGYIPHSGLYATGYPAGADSLLAYHLDSTLGGDGFRRTVLETQDQLPAPISVKPTTTYTLSVTINTSASLNGGFGASAGTASQGQTVPTQLASRTTIITDTFGNHNGTWQTLSGTYTTGNTQYTLPPLWLYLNGATAGDAWITDIHLTDPSGHDVLFKSTGADNLLSFDQHQSYLWDQIYQSAEQNRVALQTVMLDKNDRAFTQWNTDGTGTSASVGLFFSGTTGAPNRKLQSYFARYVAARWGSYTSALAWEFVNEADVADGPIASATNAWAGALHSNDPAHHNASTSIDQGWYGSNSAISWIWGNPSYPNIDYADEHHYPQGNLAGANTYTYTYNTGSNTGLFPTSDGAFASAGNPGMPVILGETGFSTTEGATGQISSPALNSDTNGVWLHNLLWSAALTSKHMYVEPWTQGDYPAVQTNNLWAKAGLWKAIQNFQTDLALSNGHWSDIGLSQGSNTTDKVWGQKNTADGQATFWVWDSGHTWTNVVGSTYSRSFSGTVTVAGFRASQPYSADVWQFDGAGALTRSQQAITSDGSGNVVVNLASMAGSTVDAAVHVTGAAASGSWADVHQVQATGLTASSTALPNDLCVSGQSNSNMCNTSRYKTSGLGFLVCPSGAYPTEQTNSGNAGTCLVQAGWPGLELPGGAQKSGDGENGSNLVASMCDYMDLPCSMASLHLGTVSVTGSSGALSSQTADWVHDTLTYTGGAGLSIISSRLTPAVEISSSASGVTLFGGNTRYGSTFSGTTPTGYVLESFSPKYIAYHTSGGYQVSALSGVVSLSSIDQPWALVYWGNNSDMADTATPLFESINPNHTPSSGTPFFGYVGLRVPSTQAIKVDAPELITFGTTPTSATVGGSGGVAITWPSTAGNLSVLPLYGRLHPGASTTDAWSTPGALPGPLTSLIQAVYPRTEQFPLTATETYGYVSDSDTTEVTDAYTYSVLVAGAVPFAPLPPMAAVANNLRSLVQTSAALTDLGVPTEWGPWQGVDGASALTWSVANTNLLTTPPGAPASGVVPSSLQTKFVAEATTLISKHWEPWMWNDNLPKSMGGHNYWSEPGEILRVGSLLVPLLDGSPTVQANLKSYLTSERTTYPPESTASLGNSGSTVSRGNYTNSPQTANTWFNPNMIRGDVPGSVRLINYYDLDAYYHAIGSAPPSTLDTDATTGAAKRLSDSEKNQDWADLYWFDGYSPTKYAAVDQTNEHVAALIGVERLASGANDAATVTAARGMLARAAILRVAEAHYVRWLYGTGIQASPSSSLGAGWAIASSSYGWVNPAHVVPFSWTTANDDPRQVAGFSQLGASSGLSESDAWIGWDSTNVQPAELVGYRYMVPELGQWLGQNAAAETNILFNIENAVEPSWYAAFHSAQVGSEHLDQPPTDSAGLFLEAARVQVTSADQLKTWLDVPSLSSGADLFWLEKAAAAILTYRGQTGVQPPPPTPTPVPPTPTPTPTPTPVPASILTNTFESGSFGSSWNTTISGSGTAAVRATFPRSGSYAALFSRSGTTKADRAAIYASFTAPAGQILYGREYVRFDSIPTDTADHVNHVLELRAQASSDQTRASFDAHSSNKLEMSYLQKDGTWSVADWATTLSLNTYYGLKIKVDESGPNPVIIWSIDSGSGWVPQRQVTDTTAGSAVMPNRMYIGDWLDTGGSHGDSAYTGTASTHIDDVVISASDPG